MADQNITCNDCGKQFTFTESEQEFYQSKGFSTPGRCPDCRAVRKAERSSSGYSGGSGYGGTSYGGGYGGGYGSGERQMYAAVCAQCGKDTQVPFSPRGDKPVYCSDCFRAKQGSSGYGGRSNDSRSGSRRY